MPPRLGHGHRCCKEPVGTAPPRLNPRRRGGEKEKGGRDGTGEPPPSLPLPPLLDSDTFCVRQTPLFLPCFHRSTVTQKKSQERPPPRRHSQSQTQTGQATDGQMAGFSGVPAHLPKAAAAIVDRRKEGGRGREEGTCKSGLFDSPVISHPSFLFRGKERREGGRDRTFGRTKASLSLAPFTFDRRRRRFLRKKRASGRGGGR